MSVRNKIFSPKVVFTIIVLMLFLLLPTINSSFRNVISKPIVFIARPLLIIKEATNQWLKNNLAVIKNKVSLEAENSGLKEKNLELELKIMTLSSLEKENEELKSLFSRIPEKKSPADGYILATVIARPPQTPYDILVLDAGTENGVKKGMLVLAFDDALLGYVTEVFNKTSKIKLISFPGDEISVMIEPVSGAEKISAIGVGQGGGNLEIKIPVSIEIHSGDRIMTVGTFPLLVGEVERVELNVSDPFQKIIFRLTVNIQQLKYVTLKND